MSLGGGSRVSSFTITIAVILVVYTLLASGIHSTVYGTIWLDPYSGKFFDWELSEDFAEWEVTNMTEPAIYTEHRFEDLDPDGLLAWNNAIFGEDFFKTYRCGVSWWESWIYSSVQPATLYKDEIIENYDPINQYSRFVHHQGDTQYETHVFYYPLFNITDSEPFFLYEDLQTSFDNGEITVVMATNNTFPTYDVFSIFGIISGFSAYEGTPVEISALIGGVWWCLLILLIVKLFVG